MIIGIGTDIVKIQRIKELVAKFGEKFLLRIFHQNEIAQAQKISDEELKMRFFAKRFAAKEAVAKAFGTGFGRGIDFVDVEVKNDELGKPFIEINGGKDGFFKERFSCKKEDLKIHLSLSDESDCAVAYAVVEI